MNQQRTDAHTHNHAHAPCCGAHEHEHTHTHTHTDLDENSIKTPQRKRKTLLWTTIIATCSHIFCCILPGIFGLLALLSGFGIVVSMPGWVEGLHDKMHGIELPVLIFSGTIVGAGWLAHFYSKEHDCHDIGDCHHESCQPRKKQVCRILLLATLLFAINLTVYIGFHRQGVKGDDTATNLSHAHDHTHDH